MHAITYVYEGAKADLDGRGFLGFRRQTVNDLQTGIVQTTNYRQDFPYTGLVASETRTLNGATLSSTSNTYGATSLGGTRSQVYLSQAQVTGADLDGTALPSTASSYQYDAYGNATQITVTSSDGYSKTTASTYSNDATNWLLGRLTGATVTSTAPAAGQQAPAEDGTPSQFGFTNVTDAAVATTYEASAALSGFNRPLTASVSGGGAQIRKNGTGDWSTSVPVAPGDTLNIRMASSAAFSTAATAMVTVGSTSANWVITTVALDDAPDPFSFTDVTNAALNTLTNAANTVTITGINTATPVSVSGAGSPQISINGGAWTTSGTITNGQTLALRLTSSGSGSAMMATVNAGGVTAVWSVSSISISETNVAGTTSGWRSIWTFSSNIGAESAGRRVLVTSCFAFADGYRYISWMTINGISAQVLRRANNVSNSYEARCEIWMANVPSGTTVTISAGTNTNTINAGFRVYAIYGLTSDTPVASGNVELNGSAASPSLTLNTNSGNLILSTSTVKSGSTSWSCPSGYTSFGALSQPYSQSNIVCAKIAGGGAETINPTYGQTIDKALAAVVLQ